MQLQKAIIAELDQGVAKDPFPVQFNPTTLHLTLSNRVEGGESQGRQARGFIGHSATTLGLELIFDTADEGTSESPRSVRDKTRQVERFLVRKGEGVQQNSPPIIQFVWGDLIIAGVVDSLTIDFDHFAANGVPLRAKVALSIKGQDRDLEFKADDRKGATAPGRVTGGLGASFGVSASLGVSAGIGVSAGVGASANVGVALAGESAAEFAARVGVETEAWRGLDLGGGNPLSLAAGSEVGFNPGLSASAGLGVAAGVEAGVQASLEASLGLESNASLNVVSGVGVGAELASSFALSSAGGVGAAIESVQNVKNQLAEQSAREAFKAPARALPVTGAPANQSTSVSSSPFVAQPQVRTPLISTGLPSSTDAEASPAPQLPRADPRSSTFGFGVPLRLTVGEAASSRAAAIQGSTPLKSKIASGEPAVTDDPTTPPWVSLPSRNRSRQTADKLQERIRPARSCGCAGRCKH
jgi:hypothetical protein